MADEKPTPQSHDAAPDGGSSPEHMAEQALSDAEHAAQSLRSEAGAPDQAASPAQGKADPETAPFDLPDLPGDGSATIRGAGNAATATSSPGQAAGLALLNDVALKVKIELGRTHMYVEDVLRLNADSVIELDKAAGDPVDIFVNDRLVARGEVLVLNENFCVRVSEIIDHVPLEDD